jgi:hypothetical protein
MTIRSVFIATFAIVLLATASNAQHIKVIDGTRADKASPRAKIYRVVNGAYTLLSSDVVNGHPVQAGQTIRLRIAATNNQGKMIVGVDNGVWRQVACEGEPETMGTPVRASISTVRRGGMPLPSVTDIIIDPFNSDRSGTCQMLVLTLSNGSDVRAKFQFR